MSRLARLGDHVHKEFDSLRTGYAQMGSWILAEGKKTAPRGQETIEILGASFTLHNPADSLPVGTGRGVVKQLAATETLQLIGGFHDPQTLVAAAPHFAAFLDPVTGKQRAAYGPRLKDQIPIAIERLVQDPDSRQAQVVVWDAILDGHHGLHDYPCTTSLQWLIRNNELHMQVHMRSNDFWLGVPYDVFMFTQLQLTIANILGIEPGLYRHSAASLHIYEKHWEQASELYWPAADSLPTFGINARSWTQAVDRAEGLHYGHPLVFQPSVGEQWLHLAMLSTNEH
jgi:thymidylate synthase